MLFNRPLPAPTRPSSITTLDGSNLEYVDNYKYLGLWLILDFGDVIYKIASNTLLNKLDAVYHSAISFVTKTPYTSQHCDLYALVGPRFIFVAKPTGSKSPIKVFSR
jgi:hypothetical protein